LIHHATTTCMGCFAYLPIDFAVATLTSFFFGIDTRR
jgi:hypothetical protein